MRSRQPRVGEHVFTGEPFTGLLAQEAADETLGARAQGFRQGELTAPDLGKQAAVLRTVERIPRTRATG